MISKLKVYPGEQLQKVQNHARVGPLKSPLAFIKIF